jgi:hypothetical protein
MNTIVVSTHRRPFLVRLCLESLCRAQRWSSGSSGSGWADKIAICLSSNGDSNVWQEAKGVIQRNDDIPFEVWSEPDDICDPHRASKWMLDNAFAQESEIVLYVEDDVIVSPDAFVLLEYVDKGTALGQVAGVCLYHETMPEHYIAAPPDPTRLHLCNGLNTCGGTAFFRNPYLNIFGPEWNCKQVLPTGFDYSAHYLMYLNKLYMVYPDLSRSMNLGFTLGNLSREQWQKYCGRSLWTQTDQALKDWRDFKLEGSYPALVREAWMEDELRHRGLL